MSHFTGSHGISAVMAVFVIVASGCGQTRYWLPHGTKTRFETPRRSEAIAVSKELPPTTPIDPPANVVASTENLIRPVMYEDTQTSDVAVVDQKLSEIPDGERRWTLDQLESLAVQSNPAIHQASASARKSMGFRDQVGRLPNPVFGYSANQLADAGTDQHVAFVEQDIVLGSKLARNEIVLSHEVQARSREVQSQRYRVLTDVRQAYYEALTAQRRQSLAIEYQGKAKEWRQKAADRKGAGEGSNLEIGQSTILLKQFELQQAEAVADLRGAWRKLTAVIGTPELPLGYLEGDLAPMEHEDVATLEAQILSESPELMVARAELCRARANFDRQQAQAIPNPTLLLSAGRDNGTGSGMINAQVGIPVPIHNRNQGNIAAARAEWSRASQNLRRVELSIQARIAEVQRSWDVALARAETLRDEIIPQAEETLRLTETAFYAEGTVGFLDVLIARKTAVDAQFDYLDACRDLAKARASLEGFVLTGGLDETRDTDFDSGLRDQALNGQ